MNVSLPDKCLAINFWDIVCYICAIAQWKVKKTQKGRENTLFAWRACGFSPRQQGKTPWHKPTTIDGNMNIYTRTTMQKVCRET